jgi:hypothetical protein
MASKETSMASLDEIQQSHERVIEKLSGELLSRADLLNIATELRLLADNLRKLATEEQSSNTAASGGNGAQTALREVDEELSWVKEHRDDATGPELVERISLASREVAAALSALHK